MDSTKFSTGAFVFTRTRGLAPRDPADVVPLVASHGLDPALIPAYPGDRVAITRAITQASTGLSRLGSLLRPIKRTASAVVFGIVNERRDESHLRLDHDFEATVSWSAEPDPSVVTGDHEVAPPSPRRLPPPQGQDRVRRLVRHDHRLPGEPRRSPHAG